MYQFLPPIINYRMGSTDYYIMEIIVVCLLLNSILAQAINLISNNSFELPFVPNYNFIIGVATGWSGANFDVERYDDGMGFGQFIDLQRSPGLNGYIEQNVTILNEGLCSLSFYQATLDASFSSYVMEVHWNGNILSTQIASTLSPTLQTLTFTGLTGINNLKFVEIGNDTDWTGMHLDQITLTCSNTIPIQNVSNTISNSNFIKFYLNTLAAVAGAVLMAIPTNHGTFFRYFYILAEDIWLYNYDKYDYEGAMWLALNVTAELELLKFDIVCRFIDFQELKSKLFVSDYKPYTRQKYVQIEQSSSVLLDTMLTFFVYTIPLNIAASVLFFIVFKITSSYEISKIWRKYYFIKSTIMQTLLEGNVAYFVYVCLGHLRMSFSFHFFDKAAVLVTVVVLWVVTVFSLTFYPLIGRYLKKKAGYFIYCVYRFNPGYCFIQLKFVIKNFVRGAIFQFLHEFYQVQLLSLGILELAIILINLGFQKSRNIFVSKLFFCLMLAYHFTFVLYNFSLYFGHLCNTSDEYRGLKELSLQIQDLNLYLLIGVTVLTMFLDLVPLDSLKGANNQMAQQWNNNNNKNNNNKKNNNKNNNNDEESPQTQVKNQKPMQKDLNNQAKNLAQNLQAAKHSIHALKVIRPRNIKKEIKKQNKIKSTKKVERKCVYSDQSQALKGEKYHPISDIHNKKMTNFITKKNNSNLPEGDKFRNIFISDLVSDEADG